MKKCQRPRPAEHFDGLPQNIADCREPVRQVRCRESPPTNPIHRTRAIQSPGGTRNMPATKVFATKVLSPKVLSTKTLSKKFLISSAIMLASACTIAGAQNARIVNRNVNGNMKSNGTMVRGKHAVMTVLTEAPRSNAGTNATTFTSTNETKTNIPHSGTVTIFSNLASKYP